VTWRIGGWVLILLAVCIVVGAGVVAIDADDVEPETKLGFALAMPKIDIEEDDCDLYHTLGWMVHDGRITIEEARGTWDRAGVWCEQ
jgi:hypothetical protein